MFKGLMFDVPKGREPLLDEPTAWGDYATEGEMLADFESMAIKSLPINGDPYEENEFLIKLIDKKTRKSIKKYKLVVWLVPTLAGVRPNGKALTILT